MRTHPKNHLIVGDINNTISEECATRVNSLSKSLIDHVLSDYSSNLNCKVNVKENAFSDHKLILLDTKTSVQLYKPKVDHETKSVDYKNF